MAKAIFAAAASSLIKNAIVTFPSVVKMSVGLLHGQCGIDRLPATDTIPTVRARGAYPRDLLASAPFIARARKSMRLAHPAVGSSSGPCDSMWTLA